MLSRRAGTSRDYTCDLAHASCASNEPGIAQRVVVKKPLVYRERTSVRGSLTLVPQKSFTNAIRHINRPLARESRADAREGVSSTDVLGFEMLRHSDENPTRCTLRCARGILRRANKILLQQRRTNERRNVFPLRWQCFKYGSFLL